MLNLKTLLYGYDVTVNSLGVLVARCSRTGAALRRSPASFQEETGAPLDGFWLLEERTATKYFLSI